jgi:WD40 repeat protein
MSPRMLLVCIVPLVTAPFAESAAPPTPRADALGDPLPAGALARLGTLRFRLPDRPSAVAVSPDGKLAAASTAGAIYLWELPSGKVRGRLQGHPQEVHSLAFSPDGRTLASADPIEGELRLWDVETGKARRIATSCGAMAFAPDGRSIAALVYKHAVIFYDLESGDVTRKFPDAECAGDVAFAPDGKTLAHARTGGEIVLRETKKGRVVGLLRGHSYPPYGLAFSPDGESLVSSRDTAHSTIKLWDVTRQAQRRRIDGEIGFTAGHFIDEGKSLLTVTHQGRRVSRLDLKTGKGATLWEGEESWVREVAVSADGRYLLLGMTYPPYLRAFDLRRDRELHPAPRHEAGVTTIAFSPDGRLVATCAGGSDDPVVHVWDAASGRSVHELRGHKGNACTVAFSPDGRTVASGGRDRTVRLWDVSTGRVAKVLTGQKGDVLSLGFSPDGKTLASGGTYDDAFIAANGEQGDRPAGRLVLWDVRGGKASRTRDDAKAVVHHLSFGRDGRSLFTAGKGLRQWDVGHGALVREREWEDRVMAISPDGRLAATVGRDNFRVSEVLTGKQLWKGDWASALAFSPDGNLFASGDYGEVTIWDAVEGVAVRKIRGHLGLITALAFSPDGRSLAAADTSTPVLLWDVRAVRPREPKGALDLDRAYRDLGDDDPKKAHQAIRHLASDPKRAVPYLAKRLEPAFPDERRSYAELIEELGDDDFEVRQRASAALAKLGLGVVARLRASLAADVSAEVRHRATRLIDQIEAGEPTQEQRRLCRAVAALERMDTLAARALLRRLTGGHADAHLTREADSALRRMALARP